MLLSLNKMFLVAWHDMTETADRGAWERMRLLAAITVSPHTKKTVTPKKLVPLPWGHPAYR